MSGTSQKKYYMTIYKCEPYYHILNFTFKPRLVNTDPNVEESVIELTEEQGLCMNARYSLMKELGLIGCGLYQIQTLFDFFDWAKHKALGITPEQYFKNPYEDQ